MPKKKTKVVKNKNIAKEKEKRRKKYRFIKTILKLILLIGILIGIGAFAFTSPLFNISEISVIGNEKNSKNLYITLSGLKVQDNIFKFNKLNVISKIEKEPYVEEVNITRKLPNTIEIEIKERIAKFLIELENEKYAYIDEKGYILEKSNEKLELVILKGCSTNINNINPGEKMSEDDVEKLSDVLLILNSIESNEIKQDLNKIDITSKYNYKLEFEKEAKEVVLGDTSDLSTKMLYMKYVLNEQEGIPGTIYLEKSKVYFSPK